MKESHLVRLQSQNNETQSQNLRLASAHRKPGTLAKATFGEPKASTARTHLFFPIDGRRRPELICFSRSASFDGLVSAYFTGTRC